MEMNVNSAERANAKRNLDREIKRDFLILK
jgi:hypothetical protein